MVSDEIKNSLRMAIEKLRIAEFELYRPSEDVATLSVCLTAHQYMHDMMHTFLLSKSIDHKKEESLMNLLEQCKSIDTQFENISFSNVFCCQLNQAECKNNYCLSIEKVNNCLAIAIQVKSIILNNLQLSEFEPAALNHN